MGFVNRPSHSVSLLGGPLFGARIWWFWCEIAPELLSFLWILFMNRPGHAVSLFGCRLFGARIWLFLGWIQA